MKKLAGGMTGLLLALGIVFGGAGNLLWGQTSASIPAEELKRLIENGDAGILVVDVQPKSVYDAGHIKGAVSYPWEPDLKSPGTLPRDKTLILYCDCSHEEDSLDVASQLKEKWGYADLKVLKGGWSNWVSMGYPTEK